MKKNKRTKEIEYEKIRKWKKKGVNKEMKERNEKMKKGKKKWKKVKRKVKRKKKTKGW